MQPSKLTADLEYRGQLRDGGWVGVTPESLAVVHRNEDPVYVEFEQVETIRVEGLDWFLVIMSLALVGFGLFSIPRNLLAGLGFCVAGGVSLYITYGRRDRVRISGEGESDDLTIYPEDVEALKAALDPYVEGSAGWNRTS
ncbi:hypothetical protein [Haloarchaeobius baliensis]|uniref:hypothetical protein n=1 Tax=Haloarchaeobius baliensis TaxID=1670458 RepID=UPI003F884521